MSDYSNFLNSCNNLIEIFADLATGQNTIFDTRSKWFYSLISLEDIRNLTSLEREDVVQEIRVWLISLLKRRKEPQDPNLWSLDHGLGWHLRDYLMKVMNAEKHKREYQELSFESLITKAEDHEEKLDFEWVLRDKKSKLDVFEKYLLYLFVEKCYNTKQIAKIVYLSDRTVYRMIQKCIPKIRGKHEETRIP